MANQVSLADQIHIASTITTVNPSEITTVSKFTTWPGNRTRVLTTLSLYGPGSGPAPVVTEVIATNVVFDTGAGTATVLVTDYDIVYPTTFLSRIHDGSHTALSNSTSSSLSTSTSSPSSTKGFSKADAAGISIGSAIIGALIAICIAWVLFKSKSKYYRRPQDGFLPSDKARDLQDMQSNDAILLSPVHDIFPQPRSHSAIISEMSQLGTRIKNHTANFYTHRTVDIRILELEEDVLDVIGLDKRTRSKFFDMLASADGREEAIRYIIAQKIFACISMTADPNTSFLPSSVAKLQRNMSAITTGDSE